MASIPLRVWFAAARPKTLWAGICPVVAGTAMAYEAGGLHVPSSICALLGAILIQVGANFANDYFDYVQGADRSDRIGPVRVTQAGLVPPQAMLVGAILVFIAACAPGLYIVYRGGWPFVIIGLTSIACGILYTAGPVALGYIGLGDLFVLVFFGPVAVGGTFYVQALRINGDVIVAGIAAGLFSVAILTVNNLRDIEQDRRAGKRTLAVRYGRRFARAEFIAAVFIASVVIPVHFFIAHRNPRLLLPMITLAAAMPTIYTVLRRVEGPVLNDALAATGKLLLMWTVLFAIGWIS